MPIAHEFDYLRPKDLAEAAKIGLKLGKKGRYLAGGTDLIGWLRDEMVTPEVLIDLKAIDKLKKIELKGDKLTIGSLVTFTDLLESKLIRDKFPLLWEAAGRVASVGVRNRATLVGNICSAVPCTDGGTVLMAYGANVVVKTKAGERKIAIEKFFVGPRKTLLKDGELATGVVVPYYKRHGAAFVKLGRYRGEDLAQASAAIVSLPKNEWRIAFGSVAPTPVRAEKLEAFLKGKPADQLKPADLKLMTLREIKPISDVRASKEYRTHMVHVMLGRGLAAASARLSGKGPVYGESVI